MQLKYVSLTMWLHLFCLCGRSGSELPEANELREPPPADSPVRPARVRAQSFEKDGEDAQAELARPRSPLEPPGILVLPLTMTINDNGSAPRKCCGQRCIFPETVLAPNLEAVLKRHYTEERVRNSVGIYLCFLWRKTQFAELLPWRASLASCLEQISTAAGCPTAKSRQAPTWADPLSTSLRPSSSTRPLGLGR